MDKDTITHKLLPFIDEIIIYARKDGILYEIKDMSHSWVHDHGSVILEIGGEVK